MTLALTTRRDLTTLAFPLDAAVTAVNGLAYLAGASALDSLLGLSPVLLRSLGAFLLVWAVVVWFAPRSATLAREVVAINAAWAVASVVVAATGTFSPTATGTAWIVAQAVVVAGLVVLQGRSLRA